ncbi:TIGR01459 family HAD-type hydrolase [Bradyrhizobium sp. CB1650]|uniref:TIGR01459 family HAD-type hydrolase n=1 Tax=Bradyrhizobium sp. CB1650 TaxID=3039153 RepID=UPI002435733B|nr:TIGR01459 family HAD-type hydrolase [Bradyrhizobium sp. CB1650]WGD49382.1 TIGR01459 family HAD-type hydrolase [Bradyrhizobium sp. CB1650]
MRSGTIEIEALSAIADRFDHVLLDQWGTLHEGGAVFPAARDCVARLRDAGKRVLVLSNSGKRARSNEERLEQLGLPPAAYDGIVTSGEVTWSGLHAREREPFAEFGRSCLLITRGGDHSIVDGLDLAVTTDVQRADFILLGGLDDAVAEPKHWRDVLISAAARRLPMLCANPDLTMFSAERLIPAPGALAKFYETLGGRVKYVGKPHAPIFDAALEQLGRPDPKRVLMVGDSIDHDVAGARAAGMLALLLTSGVHREALAWAPDPPTALQGLAGSRSRTPNWMMNRLAW